MLTTLFFPKDEAPFYRKAIVANEDVEWFRKNGAMTAEEFNESRKEAEVEKEEDNE